MSMEEKLLNNSVRDTKTGCLRWTGGHVPRGYGLVWDSGARKSRAVHRVAHEVWVGPIPESHDVDHVADRGCRYRDCIEPTHLEAVTHRENLLRGETVSGVNARKTHCSNNHEFTEENTMIQHGKRRCRECRRLADRARRAAKRDRGG